MPKLAIIATIEVAPGSRDQLVPFLVAHRDRCLRDEPGTLQFEVLIPRDDPDKIMIYEVYADEVAFEVHYNGPSIRQVLLRWRSNAICWSLSMDPPSS